MVSLDSSKPIERRARGLCSRSCLHSFVWFIAGIFAVIVLIQIQARLAYKIPFLSETDSSSTPTAPQQKVSHPHKSKKPSVRPITITATLTSTLTSVSTSTLTLAPTSTSIPEQPSSTQKTIPWSSVKKLFVFGDSYSSTSFNPHGKQPNRKNPFGNLSHNSPPNWLQFLLSTHNASYVQAYDFAVGGSTVDRNIVLPYLMGSTFREELDDGFKANYVGRNSRDKWDPDTTMFFMWFGVNDLYAPRIRNEQLVPPADIVKVYLAIADELYTLGARNMILLNLPPFERSIMVSPEDKLSLNADIVSFNTRLIGMRDTLRDSHPDLTISLFDAYNFWARVIDNPLDFEQTKTVTKPEEICLVPGGFSPKPFPEDDPLSAKCTQGFVKEYLWYGLHGTFPMHNATAARLVKDCFDGMKGYCS